MLRSMTTTRQARWACRHAQLGPDTPHRRTFGPVYLTRDCRVRTLLAAISRLADLTRYRRRNPWHAARQYGIRLPAYADGAELARQCTVVARALKDAEARFRSLSPDHRSAREVARRMGDVWKLLAEIAAAVGQREYLRAETPDALLEDDTSRHPDDGRGPITGQMSSASHTWQRS